MNNNENVNFYCISNKAKVICINIEFPKCSNHILIKIMKWFEYSFKLNYFKNNNTNIFNFKNSVTFQKLLLVYKFFS